VTTYTPYPKVIFGGATEYLDNTISSISISLGRRDIFEQALPGLISLDLETDADTPLNITLGESVAVEIQDSNGDYEQIAGGIVTDIDISLSAYGSEGSIAIYRITALGALASLNKRLVGGVGYSKEFDGDRIYKILYEAFVTAWEDVAPTLTWQELPAITTWENYEGVNQALIDNLAADISQPGDFELQSYSDGRADALTLAQDAAQSARGYLYEGRDGQLYYDAYSDRVNYVPITLTANDLLADGLRQAAQWSEIVNDVTITYTPSTGGGGGGGGGPGPGGITSATVSAADAQSQFTFGLLSGGKSTSLANQTDAERQAEDYLASRAYPRTFPEDLTVPLHSPTVSDATRDALITMEVSRAVYTQALPAVFGGTFDGFIEGIKWNLTRYTATITLVCSAQSETYPHQIWLQIPPLLTWAEYTPTNEEWIDL
jgi:hypothetical protein